MEISSITLSFPKPPPCLPFSSSRSTFFNTTAFFNKSSKSYNSMVLGKTSRSQRDKKGLTCNALFGLGVPELVVIAGVAALVFGPKQLPEVGRSIGKTVKSFQQFGNFILDPELNMRKRTEREMKDRYLFQLWLVFRGIEKEVGQKWFKAAKEFESELKKEPDSGSDTPGEEPTATSEDKKQGIEVSSSKESV
ncbi:hypothetical protein SADUNF_Sadunf05G0031800 [Salix dunnii]|uniref:Uncharacterized protein n=1 Tax=Salix dunnii TaxID=1413687 RepID=A0A835K6J8_9ROSI|nr:hypothetical protein SADUNF_Sadunf05G0031800 [Salix dunnii]